jgi:hypothetical protein
MLTDAVRLTCKPGSLSVAHSQASPSQKADVVLSCWTKVCGGQLEDFATVSVDQNHPWHNDIALTFDRNEPSTDTSRLSKTVSATADRAASRDFMTALGLRSTPFLVISSKFTPLEKTRDTDTCPVVLSSSRVSDRIQAFFFKGALPHPSYQHNVSTSLFSSPFHKLRLARLAKADGSIQGAVLL